MWMPMQIQKTSVEVAATGNPSCTTANDGLLSEQLQIDVPILLSSSDDEEEEEVNHVDLLYFECHFSTKIQPESMGKKQIVCYQSFLCTRVKRP
jgi:hypothetical protein